MELFQRVLLAIAAVIVTIVNTLLNWIIPRQKPTFPPIRNKILTKSVGELIVELRQRKVTSEEIVQAYIGRIKEVNPSLNAVIEDRFEAALKEAQYADRLIAETASNKLVALFARFPLLGIPFTVKEACGVKGLSFSVGSVHRRQVKCTEDGEAVELLRKTGCIPLLVSANPEFCFSFETNTHIHGTVSNPYDLHRTPAGSSGGEGALNGSGASLFGVGSDIGGSIRLPALFCGVFGHKPTGGLVSVKGHFPNSSSDPDFQQYLQVGPITRFARDLPILLQIMAGENAPKLRLDEAVHNKDIKIYYAYGFTGLLNKFLQPPIAFDMKLAITRALKCFQKGGLTTKEVILKGFENVAEICTGSLVSLKGLPSILTHSSVSKPTRKVLGMELFRSLIGHSLYTKEAIFMELMINLKAFIPEENLPKYRAEAEKLKQELLELLGPDGVLFFPTFHTAAVHKHTSILNMTGTGLGLVFNILGFPATHVPMGVDDRGLPIGLQVVAAPYQDKLCLHIAAELEGAFGGWVPPVKNEISI